MPTTDEIKIMFEIQQKAYRDATEILVSDLNNRIRQLERSNQELTQSLE